MPAEILAALANTFSRLIAAIYLTAQVDLCIDPITGSESILEVNREHVAALSVPLRGAGILMSVNATATCPSPRAGKYGFSLALSVLALGWAAAVPAQRSQERSSSGYVDRLPAGYRDWKLVSVAHEAGRNNDIRAILGNRIAIEAFRNGTRPFPDGAVIARLAWQFQSSARNDAVFPAPQSFVAGLPTNVQVMVKDQKRYNATGGWGYGQFEDGKPDLNAALAQPCFACHAKLDKSEDFVFTAYSR